MCLLNTSNGGQLASELKRYLLLQHRTHGRYCDPCDVHLYGTIPQFNPPRMQSIAKPAKCAQYRTGLFLLQCSSISLQPQHQQNLEPFEDDEPDSRRAA